MTSPPPNPTPTLTLALTLTLARTLALALALALTLTKDDCPSYVSNLPPAGERKGPFKRVDDAYCEKNCRQGFCPEDSCRLGLARACPYP